MKIETKILIEALELIKKGWTRGTMAKNTFGALVPPSNADAVSFCALGAIHNAEFKCGANYEQACKARAAMCQAIPVTSISIVIFNDNHATHEDVIAAFEKAIEISK